MKRVLILALLAAPVFAGPPSTCGAPDDYSRALCAYQRRDFQAAEKALQSIIDAGRSGPETVKARYFLGRTLMKTGRFAEAADVFIKIYGDDKPFYHAWNCDFLLGECRRALGKS